MASPARVTRPLRALLASALTTVSLVVVTGVHAQAEPSVSEIEKQIATAWSKAEPLIEEYNKVHENYKKNKVKQAALKKKIDPLQRQVDLASIRVGVISAQVYKGSNANSFNAMLSAGSPGALADQLSILDQLAREQQRQISGVTELKSKYDAQRKPIDELVAKLALQDKALAAKRKTIEAELIKLQALRTKAYGSTGTTGDYRKWPCPAAYEPTAGYKAAKFACGEAGSPYVWAAAGPDSYDCSGLTLTAWNKVGVSLPHNALEQRNSMPSVAYKDLQIGDLVFYFDNVRHVAIYVGDDKVMHAPTFGDVVRMADMFEVGDINGYGRPNG